jgi:F-type H+-transporting ATPase subunit gamma
LELDRWRAEEDINEIVLFYAKRESGAAFRPIRVRLLPIDRAWIRKLHARAWPSRGEPVIGLAPRRMLRVLLRQHLYIALYRAFAESLASENASRLASMGGAERNIDERLDDLERTYRRIRQTVITEELLDIISGFEALEQEVNGA